jgi:MtrB/PioB family decaheme-associated outer membrane protein
MDNFSISGGAEVGGLPRHKTGSDSKFEEYRDLGVSGIVPQLQLIIGGKKEDFYLNFDSTKTGLNDQNYLLRFGRYGLVDVEFEWDQIPHLFSRNVARTPYGRDGGGGTFTLSSRPTPTGGGGTFLGTDVRDWVNTNANDVTLKLFDGIGRFKLRYTPTPGWTFTGGYSSQKVVGKRAFGALFGPSPGAFNITELTEPIDYLTHNIELGGEYAGKGWSVGLKYNASLFHNSISTLIWDNPIHTAPGGVCTDSAVYSNATGTGPCRGRMDLYPSNQAHTWTLTGATTLPLKSHFLGTVSYGFRRQNDAFLPFTINSAIAQPAISRSSLDGDVRPLMINATVVNRFFEPVNLKGYYRYYDLDNRSERVFFPLGYIRNDQGAPVDAGLKSFPYAYSKQNIGLDAGYDVTRWLSAKLGYLWEKMHRNRREVLNSNEHILGPTFDLKPASWVLVRVAYKHSWRNAHAYDAGRQVVIETLDTPDDIRVARLADLRKFDEAARDRDKSSLFAQITPWDRLTLYAGFELTSDRFPDSVIGVKNDFNYSPSIGFVYAPLDWMNLFADYNWDRFDWKMNAIERSPATAAACGFPATPAGAALVNPSTCPAAMWTSRGRDEVNTVSLGSDMNLIKDLLGFRIQYGFSVGRSLVRASGDSIGAGATNYPVLDNTWHELLARLEYRVHKNVALRFGYYFNHATERDVGVDIMKPWMGDVDTGINVQRSIFLGDKNKGPFTAHVGFLGMRLSF